MNNPLTLLARRLLIIAFVFLGGVLARAQLTYTWDPTGTSTHTESAGTWDLSSARWNNGTSDGNAWANTSPANNAVIGWGSGSSGTPGTIKLNASVTVGNLTFAQTGTGSYAISQSSGGIALNGGTVTDNNTAASSTLTKVAFTIGSGLDFTKAGGGTLVLSSASFSGGTGNTHITGGTVILSGEDNVLPTAGTLTVDSTGAFDMNGRLQQVGAIQGAGTIKNSASSSKTFTISPSSGSFTFSGALSATTPADLILTKSGAGTQILSGTSTYTGATTVSAGTLLDNGALAATAISVSASAEFGGTGSAGSTVLYQTSALGNYTITPSGGANTTPFTVTGVMTCGSGLVMHLNVVPSNIALGNGTYTLVADTATPTGTFGTAVFDSGGLGTSGSGVVSISGKNIIYTVSGVTAGAIDHFAISAISSPQTVGTAITGITLTAEDVNNTIVPGFTGTVTYGGTAGVTGTSGSFTAGQLTGVSVTPAAAGSSLTFTVTDGSSHNGSVTIGTINPGAVDHFAISAISSPQAAGTPITGITLTAQDVNNQTVTAFTGTVTYGGTAGVTGTSGSFTAGVLSGVSVTPTAEGNNLTFTVTDGSSHTGSATIATINGGSVTHFTISAISSPQTAGTAINGITLTALDANNNTANLFAGTVTYGGTAGVTGTSGSFTAGVLTPVSVTPTVAGNNLTFTVNDGSGHTGSATIATINPGAVSAGVSTVSASPTGVPADGATTSTITVTLLDTYGNPVSGKTVTLAQTGGSGASISATSGTSTSLGVVTFTVTSTTIGSATFTATDSSDSTQITQTASVNFTGVPSAANSTAAASPPTGVVADGSTTSTINVTVLDGSSSPIQGISVSAMSTGSGNTLSTPAATDVNGQTSFTIKSTKAETKTITVTAGGVSITQQPTVQFVAGAVSASVTTVSGTSPVTADGSSTSTITVTLLDIHSNAVLGKTVTLASSRGAVDSISAASGPSDANGHVTFTVTSKTAGSPVFTATDSTDSNLAITQTATVSFTAGLVVKLQILLPGETAAPGTVSGKTGSPSGALTGIAFSAIVNAVDANWNVVSSATPTVNFTSSDGAAVLPANGATTLSSGTKTVSVALNTPVSQTVTVSDQASVLTPNTSAADTVSPIAVITLTVSSNSIAPWTVPPGVTSVQVQMWGGGGAGGGALNNNTAFGGGGGGGGAYTVTNISVTPGNTVAYLVGGGGVGVAGANGSAGTNTTFAGATTANGGGGGVAAATSTGGAASTGGTFNGAAGITGTTTYGGGGGSSAGTGANGNAGTTSTGGTAVTGGDAGANGATSSADGGLGTAGVPGGGGGGGFEHGTTARPGGNGGNGQIVLTYAVATASFSGLTASQSTNYGATGITLGGNLSASGPLYPASGETVTVTINGNAQTTTINDSTGDFSFTFNPSSPSLIPASGTPYTITYSYGGDGALSHASDASTALTVTPATITITNGITANDKLYDGTTSVTLTIGTVGFTGVFPADIGIIGLNTNGATGLFANAGPGFNIPVTVTGITITGADATNYVLAPLIISANITVPAPPFGGFIVTDAGNGSATAGLGDQLTITAETNGLVQTNVTGGVTVTFSGMSAGPDGSLPTVTDYTGTPQPFGTPTVLYFSNGVASVAGEGVLVPHKAETASPHITNGTVSDGSPGGSTVSITVVAGSDVAYRITPASTTPAVAAGDALTINIVDQYQNLSSFSGNKTINFGGLSAGPDGSLPTVTDDTSTPVNFGTGATITFTGGVNTAGGSLVAHKVESGKQLTATDGTLSATGPVGAAPTLSPTAGAPGRLGISTEPSATDGTGDALTQQPVVTVQDLYGNATSGSSVSIGVSAAVGTVSGAFPTNANNSVATFSGLALNSDGTNTLTFTSTGLISTNSTVITIVPGTYTGLAWITQPAGAVYRTVFGTEPVLAAVDQFGSPTTNGLAASIPVTVTLTSGPGTLSGTTSYDLGSSASNGVVRFTDLTINAVSNNFVLTATTAASAPSTPPVSGMAVWLDASDSSSVIGSSPVTQWNDKSGNGYNFGVPEGSGTITYNTTNINGRPVVSFPNGPSLLTANNAYTFSGSSMTLFCVVRINSSFDYNQGPFSSTDGGSDQSDIGDWSINTGFPLQAGFKRENTATSVNGPTGGNPFIWEGADDGPNNLQYAGYQDGLGTSNLLSGTPHTQAAFAITQLSVGGRLGGVNSPGSPWDGDVAEVLLYNSILTPAQQGQIYNYLYAKWLGSGGSSLSAATATFTVSPAPLTITGGITANSKAYDDTTNDTLTIGSVTFSGVFAPDNGNVGVNPGAAVGYFANVGPGSSIPVTVTGITTTGTAAGDYVVAPLVLAANISVPAMETPAFSNLSSPSIRYGTTSVILTGTISAQSPTVVYPSMGETVTATINTHAVNGTVTDGTGDFSITYNDPSLASDSVNGGPYPITYSYAGDASLTSTNDTSTHLTVTAATLTMTLASSENPSGYRDSITFTGTVSPSVAGSLVFATNGVTFDTEALSGGSATSVATTALPRGANPVTATYTGSPNYTGQTNLSQVVTNHPPVLNPANYTRIQNLELAIKLSDLLTNASDVDGDTLTPGYVSPSTNGTTLTSDATYIYYTNSSPTNVSDAFNYYVNDGFGGLTTNLVFLTVDTSQTGQPRLTNYVSGGQSKVDFTAMPNYIYWVQRSTNLAIGPWAYISTNIQSTNGLVQIIDTFQDLNLTPPPLPSPTFYRVVVP